MAVKQSDPVRSNNARCAYIQELPGVIGDGTSRTNPEGKATGGGSLGTCSCGAVDRALPPGADAVEAPPQPMRTATESKVQERVSLGRTLRAYCDTPRRER